MAFYQQGGYRSETFSCLALLARANLQKGDYAAVDKSQNELLRLALELNDQSLMALAHAERGSTLAREEKFTEALEHLNQAFAIYSAQGIQRSMGYNLANRGDVLSRLGRFDEAGALLDQASSIANKPGGELKRLSLEVQLAFAETALRQENFGKARSVAAKVFEEAGADFKNLATSARTIVGLSESHTGSTGAGFRFSGEAVTLAQQLNDPFELARAQLALAQTALLSGDSKSAASNALFRRSFYRTRPTRFRLARTVGCGSGGPELRATQTQRASMLLELNKCFPNLNSGGVQKTLLVIWAVQTCNVSQKQ